MIDRSPRISGPNPIIDNRKSERFAFVFWILSINNFSRQQIWWRKMKKSRKGVAWIFRCTATTARKFLRFYDTIVSTAVLSRDMAEIQKEQFGNNNIWLSPIVSWNADAGQGSKADGSSCLFIGANKIELFFVRKLFDKNTFEWKKNVRTRARNSLRNHLLKETIC